MISNTFSYEQNLWEEATFRSIENSSIYMYAYVTFDKKKPRPQINKIQDYNVQAQAKVPINQYEFVYMWLFTE